MSLRAGLMVAVVVIGSLLTSEALCQQKEKDRAPPWKLAESKLEAARRTCELVAQEYKAGRATYEQFALWSRRWMDAQREAGKRSEQASAVEAHVDRMKQLEKVARERVSAKQAPASEEPATEYLRLEAELLLVRTKSNK